MLELPGELVLLILDFLTLEDLKSVSLSHSRLNSLAQSHLYTAIKCPWNALPALLQKQFVLYMHKLSITGTGEWKYSLYLRDLVEKCPDFRALVMESSSSSSGWLKYIGKPPLPVTSLELCCTTYDKMTLFDFDHVMGMPQLQRVKLANFQLISPESPHPSLEEIELVNCTWDFPSSITEIGNIVRFSITLNLALHPFSFSERLQYMANNPPPNLEELVIHLNIGHRVPWKPLQNGSPLLKRLSLRGFEPCVYRKLPHLVEFEQI